MLVTLRPATDDDYEFLYRLHVAAMRPYIEQIWGWHEAWQREYFDRKFVAEKRQIILVDGADAGVLVVEEKPGTLYLGLIELLPAYQRRGIGSRLIRELMDEAHGHGLPLTLHVLKTNHPARRLYERLGFTVDADEENKWHMTNPAP